MCLALPMPGWLRGVLLPMVAGLGDMRGVRPDHGAGGPQPLSDSTQGDRVLGVAPRAAPASPWPPDTTPPLLHFQISPPKEK